MNESLNQYRVKLTQYWAGIGRKQRMWLGATVGIIILSVVLLTMLFSRTKYELAFQNLGATDAAAVMNYLDSNGIPYELSDAGKSISVPAANAAKVKVEAGSQGLVQNGSIGFEAFNEGSSPFGTTDQEFNVKYINALNGEIQQLLNAMQGVEKSNVLVNLPKDSAFLSTEEKEAASASIMITFRPGYRPTEKEVDGYYNLVKTAVPNLTVDNITISSPEGELLASSNIGGAGSETAVETHFQIQRKYESDLKRDIQQFLRPIVGMENLVVSVTSSFNFDKKRTDEELFRPLKDNNNNGVIRSEEVSSKTATGASGAGGIAGTGATDVPTYQGNNDSSNSSSLEENRRVTNYEMDKINNQIESGPYVIRDLSISVAVDKSKLNSEARTEITDYLTSLVRSQLVESGQNVNDVTVLSKKVSIIAQTFTERNGTSVNAGLSTTWLVAIGAAALAIIGALAFVILRRRKMAEQAEEDVIPAKVEYPTIDLDNAGSENQMRKQLETLAKRKPEEFVNLLRTWLVDE